MMKLPALVVLTACSLALGQSWTRQAAPTGASLRAVHARDALNATIVGDSVLLNTTNGGIDWIASPRKGCAACPAFYLDASTGWEITTDTPAVTTPTVLAKTIDGGASWSRHRSGSTVVSLGDLCFTNDSSGVAAGSMMVVKGGALLVPTAAVMRRPQGDASPFDGTTSLKEVACDREADLLLFADPAGRLHATQSSTGLQATLGETPLSSNLLGIGIANANMFWASGTEGRILSSTNGGNTWTSEATPTLASLHGFGFARTGAGQVVGWAVGDSGVILKSTPVDVVGLALPRTGIRPNPARPDQGGRVDARGRSLPPEALRTPAFKLPATGSSR